MKINRSALARKRILAIISTALFLLIAIDLVLLSNYRRPAFKMEPADAEIRLLGIEPNESGKIFDVNGKLLYDNIDNEKFLSNIRRSSKMMGRWIDFNETYLMRTLIFDVLNSKESGFYSPRLRVNESGNTDKYSALGDQGNYGFREFIDFDNKKIFPAELFISNYYKQRKYFWGLLKLRRKIKYTDITLQYYIGPRAEAQFTFEGPFFKGQNLETGDIKKCALEIYMKSPNPNDPYEIAYRLSVDEPFSLGHSFVYDKSGNRFLATVRDSNDLSSGGKIIKYRNNYGLSDVPLDSISYITVNEKPKEIIYRNVPLHFSK